MCCRGSIPPGMPAVRPTSNSRLRPRRLLSPLGLSPSLLRVPVPSPGVAGDVYRWGPWGARAAVAMPARIRIPANDLSNWLEGSWTVDGSKGCKSDCSQQGIICSANVLNTLKISNRILASCLYIPISDNLKLIQHLPLQIIVGFTIQKQNI